MISMTCLCEEKWNWKIAVRIKELFKKAKEKKIESVIKTETTRERLKKVRKAKRSFDIKKKINKIDRDSKKGIFERGKEISLEYVCEFHSIYLEKDLRWIADKKRKTIKKSEFELKDESEAAVMLEEIKKRFPDVVEDFIRKGIKETSNTLKKLMKGKDNPKKTIFQALTPPTQEEWLKQPETYIKFLEQASIRQINYTQRITDEKGEASFLRTLKKLERYFPSYTAENKKKASKVLSLILKRPDIKERPDIQERVKTIIKDAK